MDCNPFHRMPMDSNRLLSAEGNGFGENDQRVRGRFHYNSGQFNATNHLEVRTMLSCVAGGAELEPPVRAPHTVYVKTLYRIGGQDYCRHHIIRAAVAAGVITEVKPGAGPVVSMPRGAQSTEYDRAPPVLTAGCTPSPCTNPGHR